MWRVEGWVNEKLDFLFEQGFRPLENGADGLGATVDTRGPQDSSHSPAVVLTFQGQVSVCHLCLSGGHNAASLHATGI